MFGYQQYLGDGLYAHFVEESAQICLSTKRDSGWDSVYLDEEVLGVFLNWVEILKKELKERQDEVTYGT